MGLFDRGDGSRKKIAGATDHRFPDAGGVAWQNHCNQSFLVDFGQVERPQADGHSPASQHFRRLQNRPATALEVLSQGRLICSRYPRQVTFHDDSPNARAKRFIVLADISTTRWVLAISFLRPLA